MIISHKFKFIFIRSRKTASTSMELAMSQLLGDEDIITPVCPRDEKLRAALGGRGPQNYLQCCGGMRFYNHMPAAEIKQLVPTEIWSTYFKFCFERNPWDKVISLYFHRYKTEPRPSLSEFIDSGECASACNYVLYAIDDRVVVDFVGRYENLEQDFEMICSRMHFPTLPNLPRAKSQFRKDKRPYTEIFSPQDKEAISRIFSKEIEYFNYQF